MKLDRRQDFKTSAWYDPCRRKTQRRKGDRRL